MKRLVLSFLIVMMCLYISVLAYASEDIVENPSVKIVIDGKQGTYQDVPIIQSNRTLLPLRALLVNLGVQNDDDHILWNDSNKSITIRNNNQEILLKISENTAYINNEPIAIDVAPVIYKNRTYIPARFISQSLGKKVVWDGETNTIAICNEEKFNQVAEIINKSGSSMKTLKFRTTMDIEMNLGSMMVSTSSSTAENDGQKGIRHEVIKEIYNDKEQVNEVYYANGFEYKKVGLDGKWSKKEASESNNMDFTRESLVNILSATLNLTKINDSNEVILEGDIGFGVMLDSKTDPDYKVHSVLMINMDNGDITQVAFEAHGKTNINEIRYPYTAKATFKFFDYNGDFEVALPENFE